MPVIAITDSKPFDVVKSRKLRIWCRPRHQLPPV
jgi:hypothetical protein